MRFQSRFTSRFEPTRFQSRFDVGRDSAFRSQDRLSDGLFFRSLYKDGGKGALLSSAAPTASYQTDAGITLAGFGDPVGLKLDTQTGLALGPELGNPALLDKRPDTGGTVTRAGGVITFVSSSSGLSTAISQEVTGLTVGRSYRFFGRLRQTVGISASFQIRTASGGGGTVLAAGPTVTGGDWLDTSFVWVATQTSAWITYRSGGASYTIEVDESAHSFREIPGAHFSTATTADRLTRGQEPLGGVRNLLDYSQDFSNAVWIKTVNGVGIVPVVTANAGAAPDGTMTAARVQFNANGSTTSDRSILRYPSISVASIDDTASVWVKSNTAATETVNISIAGAAVIEVNAGPEWQRYSTYFGSAGASKNIQIDTRSTGIADVLLWNSQLELGSTATAYQNRVTIDDVTEAGVPDVPFDRFDGVSDHLAGNATARDILKDAPGVTFICAFRPASIAALQTLLSFSSGTNAIASRVSVSLTAGSPSSLQIIYRRNDDDGATTVTASSGGSVVGETKIFTVAADFATGGTGALVFRENGQVVGTEDIAGPGNFADTASLAARLGCRVDDSLFTNGQLFREVVILGRRASDAEIAAAEARLAALTGVTLS